MTVERAKSLDTDCLIVGDCVDALSEMPEGSIDLTVTSPPYDKLRNYNGYAFDAEGIGEALLRVTKDGGVVVWVVGDRIDGGRSMTQLPAGGDVSGHRVHRPRCDDIPEEEHAVHALQCLHECVGVHAGAVEERAA